MSWNTGDSRRKRRPHSVCAASSMQARACPCQPSPATRQCPTAPFMNRLGADICSKLGRSITRSGRSTLSKAKRILATQLDRRSGEENGGLRVVTKVAHALVEIGLGVADMVCLVDDHEVELRRRVEGEQPLACPPPCSAFPEDQVRIEERERDDGLGVLVRPFTLQMRFPQAVAQRPAIEGREVFVKAASSPRTICAPRSTPSGR